MTLRRCLTLIHLERGEVPGPNPCEVSPDLNGYITSSHAQVSRDSRRESRISRRGGTRACASRDLPSGEVSGNSVLRGEVR